MLGTEPAQLVASVFCDSEPKLDFKGGQKSTKKHLKMDSKFGSIYVRFLMQIGPHWWVTFWLKMIQMRFGRGHVFISRAEQSRAWLIDCLIDWPRDRLDGCCAWTDWCVWGDSLLDWLIDWLIVLIDVTSMWRLDRLMARLDRLMPRCDRLIPRSIDAAFDWCRLMPRCDRLIDAALWPIDAAFDWWLTIDLECGTIDLCIYWLAPRFGYCAIHWPIAFDRLRECASTVAVARVSMWRLHVLLRCAQLSHQPTSQPTNHSAIRATSLCIILS